MAKPILKWVGGKRRLLDDLQKRFPTSYDTYHEMFVGGGALFFDIEPQHGRINDVNPRLINFYNQVKENPEELIEVLQTFNHPGDDPNTSLEFNTTDRSGRNIDEYYYQQRALFNRRPAGESFDPIQEAARLLYLNRTCFNGLYRENNDGYYNVSKGSYSNPDWVQEYRIREATLCLTNTRITNQDFTAILDDVAEGDLVYLDPPYEPMSKTSSFTDYSADGFGKDDQTRLLDTITELNQQNVHVIISNSGVMYNQYVDRDLYVGNEQVRRSVSATVEGRGDADEIIATTVPREDRKLHGQQDITSFA